MVASWIWVSAGQIIGPSGKGVNAPLMPLPKYGMVFGPDGNLACYLKGIDP
jgi:hypothetical protein